MEQLEKTAPVIHKAFLEGGFVVKETLHSFNKVPFDLQLERMNKTGKVAGGLMGITRNEVAKNRGSLTYNERATIA